MVLTFYPHLTNEVLYGRPCAVCHVHYWQRTLCLLAKQIIKLGQTDLCFQVFPSDFFVVVVVILNLDKVSCIGFNLSSSAGVFFSQTMTLSTRFWIHQGPACGRHLQNWTNNGTAWCDWCRRVVQATQRLSSVLSFLAHFIWMVHMHMTAAI